MFDKFVLLAKILFPNGRAFKMPIDGEHIKLTKAIARSEKRLYDDSLAVLNSILPDNPDFTSDDATDWERRLGLPNNLLATLPDRMAAIKRKLNAPGVNPAKGHRLSIQTQLQLAGFNVYVYENIPEMTPDAFFGSSLLTPIQHGDEQHGDFQTGSVYKNKIINRINEIEDRYFNLGGSYKASFFIGGATPSTVANVPLVRKDEFRELVLKLKQVQNVVFYNINFI